MQNDFTLPNSFQFTVLVLIPFLFYLQLELEPALGRHIKSLQARFLSTDLSLSELS